MRVNIIKDSLSKLPYFHLLDVIYCESADRARIELQRPIDLILLDVLIPKKINGTPQALHSITLLTDICNPKKSYIRPRLIIGLTADIEELGVYQEQFAREAAVVLRGSLTELDWLDSLHAQMASVLSSDKKINQSVKDRLLITVHGIRTYGQWQAKISDEVMRTSRSFDSIEIKYGRLDLLRFAIPYFRKGIVARESLKLSRSLSDFKGREIHIIAHSFGTFIVSNALKELNEGCAIKSVIFCGSPMRESDDIEHIVRSSELTVNDCGTHDFVLLLARLCMLGVGDAGRVGFLRENSSRFQNRYFEGGHSLYFKNIDNNVVFYERHWIPMITLGKDIKRVDLRESYFGEDFADIFIKIFTFLKPILYLVPLPFIGIAIWRHF